MLNYKRGGNDVRDAWFKWKLDEPNTNHQVRSFVAGYNSNKNARSDIILFYYGEKVPACPYTFGQIINFQLGELEDNHDYIQWLFPNVEASNFNPDAPLLTPEDIELFKTNKVLQNHVDDALTVFMWFLGYYRYGFCEEKNISYSDSDLARLFMLKQFNHNHLRITRMIKFLKLINHWQLDIVFNRVYQDCSVESSKKYWSEAYHG